MLVLFGIQNFVGVFLGAIVFQNNAASVYTPRNPISQFLIPDASCLAKVRSGYFNPVPAPLVDDENLKRITVSKEIVQKRVKVYFNIVATWYSQKLNMKARLLMVEHLSSAEKTRNKKLKDAQLI